MRLIIQKTAPYTHWSGEIYRQALSRSHAPLQTHHTQKSAIPTTLSKSPSHLPPLSKVRHCHTKKFGRLPEGLLYTHRTSLFPQPSQNHINRFAPHHALASLVKGEVLSPEKIRATTGGIVTPPTLPKPHYPPKKHYILSHPNLFCTFLTSPSTRAILLLALAKTN